MTRRLQVEWLVMAVALVVASGVLAWGVRGMRSADDTLTVTGSARRAIRSDFAIWHGAFSTVNEDVRLAYRENRRQAERVRAFLRQEGVPASSITWPALVTATVETDGETRRRAYELTQSFQVRSPNVDWITGLASRAGTLISEGIPLTSQVDYLYTRLAALRVEMLAEATQDARRRAEVMAGSVGSQIGTIRSARVGVFQITARHSTDVSGEGICDTSSVEKDITAVVSVTFALRPSRP